MKKYEEPKKITTLGVVIFYFISLLIGAVCLLIIDGLAAVLVLKTDLPESILRAGSVVATCIGMILATAVFTSKGRVKGIIAAAVIGATTIVIKIIGNNLLELGGYFDLNGLIGILFTLVFALVGGMIGSHLKR